MLSINDIQTRMRAAGSHWFDADTMRFFGTAVESGVWNSADGREAYFVTRDDRFDRSRGYTIRRYDAATNSIETIGELAEWDDLRRCKLHAKHAAGVECVRIDDKLVAVKPVDDFIRDLAQHTGRIPDTEAVRLLIKRSKYHQALAVSACNTRTVDPDREISPKVRGEIETLAASLGCTGVVLGGDPRGCTVKLVLPDGYTNDWGREGLCVPME